MSTCSYLIAHIGFEGIGLRLSFLREMEVVAASDYCTRLALPRCEEPPRRGLAWR